MEGVFNMTKSIIELELEEKGYNANVYDKGTLISGCYIYYIKDVNSAIQKALEDLKKKKFCKTHDGLGGMDYCDLAEGECIFVYRESDVEKCFGEVKDAKNK